jgi:ammonium transporter, Amt family
VTVSPICLILILLSPLAAVGLALINTGLGRARSASIGMLGALFAIATAALVYFAVGFSWQGFAGGAEWALRTGSKLWGWIGAEPLMMRGVVFDGSTGSLVAAYGMFAVATAAVIPLGTGAERWRLGASCASAAVLAAVTYPIFAHWVWGGGWLAKLGENYGIARGVVDAGGAGPIHGVGGMTALAMAWILGPRRGKYTRAGMPTGVPGHSAVLVSLGCAAAWAGFLGLDGAGAMLFGGAEAGRVALVAVNVTLSAAAGALAAGAVTRFGYRKVDASLCANGWVAGLVAASAGCATLRPAGAVLAGAVAGAAAIYAIERLELHLSIDDPSGAISVHGIGGLWGLMVVGLLGATGQWLAQFAEAATVVGFVLPVAFGLNWALDRMSGQRVAPGGERLGIDLHELGAGAYPDFLTHGEDSWLP